MQTKTDHALAQAEERHAHDPERAEVIARVRRFKAGWYELAEALSDARRGERWRAWGFQSFEDYYKRELHLRAETVDKLTGSFVFLKSKAPEVLRRDGRSAPIPTYQAVDFLRRVEEESSAPEETRREIRQQVLEEGAPVQRLQRRYQEVVFPLDGDQQKARRTGGLKQAIEKLAEQLALARDEGAVPKDLAADVEEPLSRLLRHVAAA